MISWFNSLSEAGQVALIGALISAFSAVVAVILGAALGYASGIRASRLAMQHSETVANRQLGSANYHKIAEFRIRWIEDLRESVSRLYEHQYELSYLHKDIAKSGSVLENDKLELKDLRMRRRQLYIKIAGLKRDILLRINPSTDHDDEKELRRILRESTDADVKAARDQRRALESVTSRILSAEWQRLKIELHQTLKG